MTVFFKSHEITIMRMRRVGNSINRFLSATFTAVPADIQGVPAERVNLFGGRIGKTYQGFVDASVPIQEGDVVQVTDTGKRYAVQAVTVFEGAGLLDHKELILIAQE